jgi:hypothetical protein
VFAKGLSWKRRRLVHREGANYACAQGRRDTGCAASSRRTQGGAGHGRDRSGSRPRRARRAAAAGGRRRGASPRLLRHDAEGGVRRGARRISRGYACCPTRTTRSRLAHEPAALLRAVDGGSRRSRGTRRGRRRLATGAPRPP